MLPHICAVIGRGRSDYTPHFLDQAAAANALLERIESAVDRSYNGTGKDPRSS
jgi:hypothetical protein